MYMYTTINLLGTPLGTERDPYMYMYIYMYNVHVCVNVHVTMYAWADCPPRLGMILIDLSTNTS